MKQTQTAYWIRDQISRGLPANAAMTSSTSFLSRLEDRSPYFDRRLFAIPISDATDTRTTRASNSFVKH